MTPRKRRVRGSGSVYYHQAKRRWVGSVVVAAPDGSRIRRYVSGATADEAQGKLDQVRGQTAGRKTLHGFLTWYVDTYTADRVELGELHPRTARSTTAGLAHVRAVTPPGLRLDDLDAQQLDMLRRSLAHRGLAASTQARILSQLSAALDVAVYHGLLQTNRARLTRRPKVPKKRRVILSPAEARRLLDDVRGHVLEPWYAVAVPAGLRRSEALGLSWDDVDLDTGQMHVGWQLQRAQGGGGWVREPLKGRDEGESRDVTLAPVQLEVLRRHRKAQAERRLAYEGAWGNDWDLVVVDRGGVPIWGDRVWRDVTTRTERLGLPRQTPHSFRRSAFSLLLAEGVDLGTAMELCGWMSSRVALEVYAQATKAGVDGVAEVFQRLYGEES